MKVEIVVIGSELLLGDILDTNTQFIARRLREEGFDLQHVVTVGDHLERIISALRQATARADAVIAAGGLGPTVDDPTRAAAAQAAGVELVFHPELWEIIQARFQSLGRSLPENNRKQAYLPAGSSALPNPFGTAPGFSLPIGKSILFAVPGVPSEMEAMITREVLPALRRWAGSSDVICKRTIHVAGPGESQIDQQIGRWESMENPTVGLIAHAGLTDIRIVARAGSEAEARKIIAAAEEDIRSTLGESVVGAEEETLAGAILRLLPAESSLCSVEYGSGGALAGLLGAEDIPGYRGGLMLGASAAEENDIAKAVDDWKSAQNATHGLGLILRPVPGGFQSDFLLRMENADTRRKRKYMVPYEMACRWAANTVLTALWNSLKESRNRWLPSRLRDSGISITTSARRGGRSFS